MGQDALDHRRIDDGGDDLQLAATVRALFEVDGEDALEQPRPTQARRSVVRGVLRGTLCRYQPNAIWATISAAISQCSAIATPV
jgi:hypothetical protein